MPDVGKWLVNYDNGLKFGVIDLRCPRCDGCVVCPKVDIPNFCGKCGMFMKEMSEKLDRRKEGEAE